jgi:hypothetical protein
VPFFRELFFEPVDERFFVADGFSDSDALFSASAEGFAASDAPLCDSEDERFFDADARFFFAGTAAGAGLIADSISASSTATSAVLSKSQRVSVSG